MDDTLPPPALVAEGITKTYGGVTVLHDASLSLRAGRVHALVGENGAGKSTMLGALAGRITPTAGTIRIDGRAVESWSPRESRSAGLAAVYQELTVLPSLTAWENVFLGGPPARAGLVDRRRAIAGYRALAERLDVDIPPERRAGDLSVAQQQMLEIMRATRADARVLLLDEPTASLAAAERATLLRLIRRLAAQGVAIALVTHNLDEVLEVSDDVSVFRNGALVAGGPRDGWTKRSLVEQMLGAESGRLATAMLRKDLTPAAGHDDAARQEVLSAKQVSVPGVVDRVDIAVRQGEIVGVGGLVGSGRSTLLRALAGAVPRSQGTLAVDGAPRPWPRSVRAAIRAGLALVPEERKRDGLVLGLSAAANIVLSDLGRVSVRGWMSRRAVRSAVLSAASDFALPERMLWAPAGTLSGGNQQKAVLARWSYRLPRVLLADEPGRGVDLGAKAQILGSLRRFVDDGGGVLMVSSENEELLAFADRILIMASGRIVAELDNRSRTVTEHDLLTAAFTSQENDS